MTAKKQTTRTTSIFTVKCTRCSFAKNRLHKGDASLLGKLHAKRSKGHVVKLAQRKAQIINRGERFRLAPR